MNRDYYERLHQHDRIRQQKQLRRAILDDKEKVDTHSYHYHQTVEQQEITHLALERLIDTHHQLASATIFIKIGYILILFLPICAYLINILLIFRPTEYLVTQSLGRSFVATIAMYIVPLVIVVFEMGIASTIYTVIDEERPSSQRTADLLVWVTPTMLLATNLALYGAENRLPKPYELLLLVALLFLAYISDAAIVKGYRTINQAYAFVWFTWHLHHLEGEAERCHDQSDRDFQQAGQAFDRYSQNLEHYNRTYPEAPLQPLSFDDRVGTVIAQWLAAKKAADR